MHCRMLDLIFITFIVTCLLTYLLRSPVVVEQRQRLRENVLLVVVGNRFRGDRGSCSKVQAGGNLLSFDLLTSKKRCLGRTSFEIGRK